jgi:hypothetical protein
MTTPVPGDVIRVDEGDGFDLRITDIRGLSNGFISLDGIRCTDGAFVAVLLPQRAIEYVSRIQPTT